MITDTTLRTPNDVFLAVYCLVGGGAAGDAFLARLDRVGGIDTKLSVACDYARDTYGSHTGERRTIHNCRAWDVLTFVENF